MPIMPDTKNWTWVLERACAECGFDPAAWSPSDVAAEIRRQAEVWPRLLDHPAARARPTDERWSATEYGCHVRDVFRLFDHRLERMLTEDAPDFANWDQDVTAVEDRYDLQDPAVAATELVPAALRLADRFDAVSGDEWERTGRRSDGATFTVGTFSIYLLHDPLHHVWDVESGFALLAPR